MNQPPAAQFPADAHDTERTSASPPTLRATEPGTGWAVPHKPPASSTTNACIWPEGSAYQPPAAQFPADAHDTERISENSPALRADEPGTRCTVPHEPPASSTTNA